MRVIGFWVDRSNGDWAMKLHQSLMGGHISWVVNDIDHITFKHKAVKGHDQAIPLSSRHIVVDEREKLLLSCANVWGELRA